MGKPNTSTANSSAATAAELKSLQIFKPGRHVTMAGQAIAFTEADLQATCKVYDPALHEAPLVVGHPAHDLPAYGWVKSIEYCDGGIDATPAQVNSDFADMVAAGAYKKISASFYAPDAPQNPVPGSFYLRHVGFLGAAAPAVKGLRSPSFADGEAGVLEFSEWDDMDNASLWRSLREWFIGKFGQEEADRVVPGYQVKSLEQGAQDELREAQTEVATALPVNSPSFTESQPRESNVTAEEKAALQAENTRLAAELQASRTAIAKAAADAAHANHVSFCEGLITQGRLLPAHRDVVLDTLDHFSVQPAVIEFGEGEAKAALPEALKAMLTALPVQVEFSEVATGGKSGAAMDFSDPAAISAAAVELQVEAEKAGNPILHAAAVAQVMKRSARA